MDIKGRESGRADVVSLRNTNATPTWYLTALTYDIFGRPRIITHANTTTDTRTYADKTNNFRLASILTKQGASTTHLSLSYASYSPTGLLTQLNDLRNTTGLLSNTATFGYDGLGRLTSVTNSPNLNGAYTYDYLGNITSKEGQTFCYENAADPHELTKVCTGSCATGSCTSVTHDANGNRASKVGQTYGYNGDDRLETITVGGTTVQPRYDYTGRQVLKVVGAGATRYYSDLMEAGSDGYLTKHYFAGGVRIASQRVYAPGQFAAGAPDPAVQVAAASLTHPAVVLLVRKDVQTGVALCVVALGTGLLLAPWRRKRVVGIAVRHGHVILVVLAVGVATLPWPLAVGDGRAWAQTGGTIYHYHVDHLGSTQVITDVSGVILQQIRYKPYGEIRYTTGSSTNRYQFTGYETDPTSSLEYAGARFYDPALGMFLTHDPARQFANPYTYVGWNPVNGTDPTGAIFGLDDLVAAIIIGVLVGAAASGIQAAVNGASVGDAFKAAAIGGAIGGAAAGIGAGIVGPALNKIVTPFVANQLVAAGMSKATAALTAKLAVTGTFVAGGLAQAGYGASRGDYTGVIGLGLTVGVLSVGTGSFYEGVSGALGGVPDYIDALWSGTRPLPGTPEYAGIQEGVQGNGNPNVRAALGGKLDTGEIATFKNRLGSANGFTIGEQIYVSHEAVFSFDVPTRAQLLSHEYFHVLENRAFGWGGYVVFGRNERYANFFATRVAPDVGRPYTGDPNILFRDITSGRYDAEL